MNKLDKETIHILSKNYQRCTKYTGFMYLYKNVDTNICGSFAERLLEFYQSKFNVIFKIDETI